MDGLSYQGEIAELRAKVAELEAEVERLGAKLKASEWGYLLNLESERDAEREIHDSNIEILCKERDEALAEVERLRAEELRLVGLVEEACDETRAAESERDELRDDLTVANRLYVETAHERDEARAKLEAVKR